MRKSNMSFFVIAMAMSLLCRRDGDSACKNAVVQQWVWLKLQQGSTPRHDYLHGSPLGFLSV